MWFQDGKASRGATFCWTCNKRLHDLRRGLPPPSLENFARRRRKPQGRGISQDGLRTPADDNLATTVIAVWMRSIDTGVDQTESAARDNPDQLDAIVLH